MAGIVHQADASGGADPEPLASARQQAPEQFRVNQRAVLPSDYEDLAMTLFPARSPTPPPRWPATEPRRR